MVPSGSEAFADTVIVPLTVEPLTGDVIDTVGAWLLATVTVTVATAVAPWLSVAVALNTRLPFATFVVSNAVENGAVVSVTLVPSGRSNRTLAIVPSGSEAFADTVIVPLTVEPLAGDVIETVGAWLLATVTVTVATAVAPWLSVAVAVNTRLPFATLVVSNAAENGAVVSVTLVPSGRSNRTLATVPSASAALAATVIVPLTVEPLAGDVIETIGAWLVLVTVTEAFVVWVADVPVPVIVKLVVPAPVPAATVRVRVELPPAATLVGLNEPVTPVGSPDTDRLTVWAAPAVTAVLTVYVVVEPAATVCDAGLTEMLKSLVCAPQLGNLNVPTRVRQLNEPFAPMYSDVNQNVQSSVGSMFIEL